MAYTDRIPQSEIQDKVTAASVAFAEKFGKYLGTDEQPNGKAHLSTSQIRKFYGEVKRQQMTGYSPTDFILLKPKLAYAVGRDKKSQKNTKIQDFYDVIADAIGKVNTEHSFENFVKIFEAIVAYHKLVAKD